MSHLRELEIEPGLLSFELVESIFLDDCDAITNTTIEEIKRLGIDIEIDDFGTGHASIVSLLKLSPKRLKIDRQFIGPILKSNEHSRLVASIIEIGKSMGVEVIAEGLKQWNKPSFFVCWAAILSKVSPSRALCRQRISFVSSKCRLGR